MKPRDFTQNPGNTEEGLCATSPGVAPGGAACFLQALAHRMGKSARILHYASFITTGGVCVYMGCKVGTAYTEQKLIYEEDYLDE